MFLRKNKAPVSNEPMDLNAVMQKFDRESNTRIWEGKGRAFVNCILAAFSLFCIYVTLFASWLEELRLTTFVAFIVLLGYLVYPAKDGKALESIRLNALREAMDDIRALQLCEELYGREYTVKLIDDIAGMDLTFYDYPKTPDFLLKLRDKIALAIENK